MTNILVAIAAFVLTLIIIKTSYWRGHRDGHAKGLREGSEVTHLLFQGQELLSEADWEELQTQCLQGDDQ